MSFIRSIINQFNRSNLFHLFHPKTIDITEQIKEDICLTRIRQQREDFTIEALRSYLAHSNPIKNTVLYLSDENGLWEDYIWIDGDYQDFNGRKYSYGDYVKLEMTDDFPEFEAEIVTKDYFLDWLENHQIHLTDEVTYERVVGWSNEECQDFLEKFEWLTEKTKDEVLYFQYYNIEVFSSKREVHPVN